MNDLKNIVQEHLDEALPTADERRADLDKLWRKRRAGRFGVFALVGAAGFGAVATAGLFGAGMVEGIAALVGPSLPDDGEGIRFVVTDADGEVEVSGTPRIHAAYLSSSHSLPAFPGSRPMRGNNFEVSGFDFLNELVDFAPGVSFSADACVDAAVFAYQAADVPAQVALDVVAARYHWVVKGDESGHVVVRCAGAADGPMTTIDDRHRWPQDDVVLDAIVSLDVDNVSVAEAAAALAKQVGLPLADGQPTKSEPVSLRLQRVSLRTALLVLSESAHTPVHVVDHSVEVFGAALPRVQRDMQLLLQHAAQQK